MPNFTSWSGRLLFLFCLFYLLNQASVMSAKHPKPSGSDEACEADGTCDLTSQITSRVQTKKPATQLPKKHKKQAPGQNNDQEFYTEIAKGALDRCRQRFPDGGLNSVETVNRLKNEELVKQVAFLAYFRAAFESGNQEELDWAGKMLLNKKDWTAAYCGEMTKFTCFVARKIARERGQESRFNAEEMSVGNHQLLVLGRPPHSDPKDIDTWGNAVLVDCWANTVVSARDFMATLKAPDAPKFFQDVTVLDENPPRVEFTVPKTVAETMQDHGDVNIMNKC